MDVPCPFGEQTRCRRSDQANSESREDPGEAARLGLCNGIDNRLGVFFADFHLPRKSGELRGGNLKDVILGIHEAHLDELLDGPVAQVPPV